MKLPGPPMAQRHLQPGELLVTQEPQWVITLLGSCVAVTMFNARFRLAAICHGLLPAAARQGYALPESQRVLPVLEPRHSGNGRAVHSSRTSTR